MLTVAIIINQIYGIILIVKYDFQIDNFPHDFYLLSEIGGIAWFILITIIAIVDTWEQEFSLSKIFNIDFAILAKYLSKVLKYFGGCAAAVILLTFINPVPEMNLANKTPLLILLSFITTVIMAPICEEMAFRGYLYSAMLGSFKRIKERLVVNAMLFAAAHVFLAAFLIGADIPYYIFIIGYFLAKLYEESRSILPCILLHALNNGLVFAIDFLFL